MTELDLPECLLEETVPIADCSCHGADMHVVEMVFGPGPVLLAVVDLEFDVWRNPDKLDLEELHGWRERKAAHHVGCIGLRSTALT